MIGSDYILEALNIYHTTDVGNGSCFSGDSTSALVLKGVNLTLHSGEVMAILGSKGSGKRALLDVIARRAEGRGRGSVLLNGAPLTRNLFQQRCGYVTHQCDFIPGLTVSQTLHYTPTILSGYLKSSKVRQVLADLALSQVANKKVENLNISERRRLAIGVQLVRDPVMLLLDEPTQNLDPLASYLLISILSNTAKKTGCGILLSMEKPRSDVFPFLDRALFLCLGGAVYSGGTRAMLEYFHNIGFPCPQLENPLMYYLCLSTVDRSSCSLSKNEVIKLLYNQDSDIELIAPEKFKSPIWERFRIVFYKGSRLNYVQCIGCALVLVYKSRTGTASLLRHRCSRFPISVYDLKLEKDRAILAAAGQLNIFEEMASSQNGENIVELKQEMVTDEEESEEQDDDQKYTSEQTDKGLLESFSILEKTFITGDELLLSREEIEHAKRTNDPELFFERPRNHRHSSTWDRFEIVYYRNIRQNFAKCFSCNSIVSYKKTTGTASLIRHKCKNSNLQQSTTGKNESLTNLLVSTPNVAIPPPLTPAPIFSPKQSTSSASVSSTSTTSVLKVENQKLVPVIVQGSRALNVPNTSEMNLINSQIEWLSQCLISTEILGDSSYLSFLQNLINYGADYGKQNITSFINREIISRDTIPKKCVNLQNELIMELKDIEFSISYSTWTNLSDDKYVTVFGYYFNQNFEYKNAILGTRKISDKKEIVNTVTDIVRPYTSFGDENQLKCVTDESISNFDNYPCVINRISNVILTVMNSNDESRNFFKRVFVDAHDILSIPQKSSFEDTNDVHKMKMFYALYQFLKNEEGHNGLMKKFMNLLGILFSAVMSLVETNEDGNYCVSANRVYLWYKKFLKHYTDFTSTDKVVNAIGQSLLKLIKENFNNNIRELYQIAVFLNPNFKSLKFLTQSERTSLLDMVKRNLEKLMSDESTAQPPSKKPKMMKNQAHLNDTFLEFMDITMESVDDQVDSEIQRYMGYKLENPIDILEFWASNDAFPYLKKLAKNHLNLPSCTFHNNCCFLTSDNTFYQKCKYLPTEDVESLTFLHQNIKI